MRYATAQAGYVVMVLAILGTATAMVVNLDAMTAKPSRAWDAEIDRIVAQQLEKRRLAALTAQGEETAADDATGSTGEDAGPAQAAPRKAAAAPGGKDSARRGPLRVDRFLPAAFVDLPKFAATKAASVLLRVK